MKTPDCPQKKACGLCVHVNDNYEANLEAKYQAGLSYLALQAEQTIAIAGAPQPLGYRAAVKVAVRPGLGKKRFSIGLFAPGTHRIGPPMYRCPIQASDLNPLLKDLEDLLETSLLRPYSDESKSGDLKYLALRQSLHNKGIMLTFVVHQNTSQSLYETMAAKLVAAGHKLAAVYLHHNPSTGNAIFANSESKLIWGQERLNEEVCGIKFRLSPTSFFQINPSQAAVIYQQIQDLAREGASQVAWDLYCGMGPIAMLLAKKGFQAWGIEENPQAIADAKENAELNGLVSLMFTAGKVEDCLANPPANAAKPHVVIANPARAGLAPAVRAALVKASCQRLIYLSCNLTTLKRDLADLTAQGFHLDRIQAFDMFAQTDKLEWLAVLSRF